MKLRKLLALLLALTLLAGILAGCGGETQKTPDVTDSTSGDNEDIDNNETPSGDTRYGGHLDVRLAGRPDGLDPLKQVGQWKYMFTTCVFEGPLSRDAENNIRPGVCDYELSEDMLTLKLWVAEGKVFQNGDLVDIYDVEASITRALNKYSSITKYVAPYVADMTVEGDTLTITFSSYDEKCLYYLAAYQTWCAIMPKEICEKYSDSYIVDEIEDCIGTGPYVYSDFKDSVSVTVSKWKDYVPVENDYTGLAGTKYGYLDSITFWYNSDDGSAALALLAGDYDVVEVIPAEYEQMAADQGIKLEVSDSNLANFMIFNTKGTNNLCAKYPSLRKAIMAAIDYESYLSIVTDDAATMDKDLILADIYSTDAFINADYYGEAKQDVVDKYLAQAKTEGYNGEPLQIVFDSSRNDVPTLISAALDDAGINYKLSTMENAAWSEFTAEPANNWDFYFTWTATSLTPSLLQDAVIKHWNSTEKDDLLEQMRKLDPTSDEYIALWQQFAQLMVDECAVAYMSTIDWWWWCPEEFHPNDDGIQRYFYNSYWDNPAEHAE